MKKITKWLIFVVALLCNTAFLLLCGYGTIHHEETATYWDPILGVVAVLALAWGNVGVGVQVYYRIKYHGLKCRSFDLKFWRQCLFMVIYYVGSVVYLSVMTFDFMVSYISIFAIALSPFWLLGGSRVLWTAKDSDAAYYLDDSGKWYEVHTVTENDDVMEIRCTAPGDRERTITIGKWNQKL